MNKILIDNDKTINLDNHDYQLIITNDCNITLNVNKDINTKVSILIKNSTVNIRLLLNDNSNLIINQLGIDSSINYDVHVKYNCNLDVVDSIISKIDSINNIKLFHEENDSNIRFYTNGINYSNYKMYYNIDGIVKKNIKGIYLEENSKIINIKKGDSKIIPNLIVDTKEISANHSAYIGVLDKNMINYLMSRGIELKKTKELLIKSILLSNMSLDTNDFIKEITLYMEKGG